MTAASPDLRPPITIPSAELLGRVAYHTWFEADLSPLHRLDGTERAERDSWQIPELVRHSAGAVVGGVVPPVDWGCPPPLGYSSAHPAVELQDTARSAQRDHDASPTAAGSCLIRAGCVAVVAATAGPVVSGKYAHFRVDEPARECRRCGGRSCAR